MHELYIWYGFKNGITIIKNISKNFGRNKLKVDKGSEFHNKTMK